MKKIFRLLCLAAILCVAYLAIMAPRGETEPVLKPLETDIDNTAQRSADSADGAEPKAGGIIEDAVSRADGVIDDAVSRADEAIGDAVKQADEVIGSAVEQADQALADAVESAAEGAKQGFVESLKESASDFWKKLFP